MHFYRIKAIVMRGRVWRVVVEEWAAENEQDAMRKFIGAWMRAGWRVESKRIQRVEKVS